MSVHSERSGPVVTVVIDRPEVRNAVDADTADALVDAFHAVDADETVRAAVLTGAGGTFCAGADLRAVAAGRPNRLEPDGAGPMGPTRMRVRVPVIAAVEGHAVAGGLELAVWCDLRVVAEDAVFGVFCRRWGVTKILVCRAGSVHVLAGRRGSWATRRGRSWTLPGAGTYRPGQRRG